MSFRSDWDEFTSKVYDRMVVGEKEYGDASYSLAAKEVIGELEQEALDIMGWGYFLWKKCKQLEERLK